MVLDTDSKTFVVHVAIREQEEMIVDRSRKAQIKAQSRAQVKALLFDKDSAEVLAEYSDYSDVYSVENVAKLPENTRINEHAIELEEGKQPPFGSIYSLDSIELKTLKTYIETNLANNFIRPSKSSAEAPILFNKKLDRTFCLCVDYQGFNNITIKN